MRIVHYIIAVLLFAGLPLTSQAAGGTISVRGISFSASPEKGPTDPRLAPYEANLRANLRFESFRYLGESAATVTPGGKASLGLPSGGRVELSADKSGNVMAQWRGRAVPVAPGNPAVFLDRGGGIIVLVQ
jgi:hypothetical protein